MFRPPLTEELHRSVRTASVQIQEGSLERLEDRKERQDEEDKCGPVNESVSLMDDCARSATSLGVGVSLQMAKRAQVMAAAPAASPSALAKAYAAAVVSRKTKARKTKILVQMPAPCV